MRCPLCQAENAADADACFACGRALDALVHGFVLAKRYEIRRCLGSGGMGRVYAAWDAVLEEPVAIKVLRSELTRDPELARRFVSEIRLARRVSHANVCRIHEYNQDQGLAFISMELLEGRSLKQLVGEGRVAVPEAFELGVQAAEGLAAIHAHGIVHRDFKSANIMVDGRGVAKILDFGIAKHVEGPTTGFTTGPGQVFGTPEYMSPEQIEGARVDARSDVYAFGCVIHEIFTGRPPFQGATALATLLKHLQEKAPLEPAAPELPAGVVGVLSRALAKDPALRFASMDEAIVALRHAQAATLRPAPTTAGRPDTMTLFRDDRPGAGRRHRLWAAAAGACGILAAVAILDGLAGPGQSELPAAATPAPASTPAARPLASPRPAEPAAPPPERRNALASAPPRASPLPLAAMPSPAVPIERVPHAALAPGAVVESAPFERRRRPTLLSLIVVPEAEVFLDDRSLGVVARGEFAIDPGRHALRVVHPDYQPLPRRFNVEAGETLALLIDLQEKAIPKHPR